jgi:RHH-type proline utilization regulon transcriptional repressor/proline dehydrogenase/delta 1-pyrroline-5-carboxylate dehydrogenase
VGAVLGLTDKKLEFQRLYGMGTKLHGLIKNIGHDSRIYKPIGEGKELLAYLIRRMIENGANTSFMMHENIENHIDMGIEMDSYESLYHPRPNSGGMDFSDPVALNELKKYHDKKCT